MISNIITKKNLLLIGILILHAYLRLQHPLSSEFGYDQAMIADKTWSIAKEKKLTLIGTRVGEESLYVPPFYIYLASIFAYIWQFHPLANYYHAYFWAFLALVFIYKLVRTVFNQKVALWTGLLYTVSPFLLFFDRKAWNPNPLMALSALSLWLVFLLVKRKTQHWAVYMGLALAIGLAISSHFTGIFLLVGTIGVLSYYRVFEFKKLILFSSIILLFFTPLIVFDVRNEFLNTKGVLAMISQQKHNEITSPLLSKILLNLVLVIQIYIENIGKIVFDRNLPWTYLLTGFIVGGWFINKTKDKAIKTITLIFSLPAIILLAAYFNAKPEYYLLTLMPVFLMMYALIIHRIIRFKNINIILGFISLTLFIYDYSEINKPTHYHLQNKIAVIKYLKDQSNGKSISVYFDMHPGDQNGFDYLYRYYQLEVIPQVASASDYELVFPNKNRSLDYNYISGDIGVYLKKPPEITDQQK